MICKNCGNETEEPVVEVAVDGNFGPHFAKAICPECGRFIQWIQGPRKEKAMPDEKIKSYLKEREFNGAKSHSGKITIPASGDFWVNLYSNSDGSFAVYLKPCQPAKPKEPDPNEPPF
jgi:hypothetical protein